jgi:hypothetical protein
MLMLFRPDGPSLSRWRDGNDVRPAVHRVPFNVQYEPVEEIAQTPFPELRAMALAP